MATNEKNGGFWPSWESNKLFSVLLAILLVYGIVWIFVSIQKTMAEANQVGVADQMAPTISVTGVGDASAVPDTVEVDLTITVDAATANLAQDQGNAKSAALVTALQEAGIAETDMQTTEYNVTAVYDYDVSPAVITGYRSTQTVTLDVANVELAQTAIAKAGDLGVSQIGDLRMTVADEDEALAAAREAAISDAYAQAVSIAAAMGQELGGVVSYYESQGGYYPYYSRSMMAESSMMDASGIVAGENDYEMNVTITYSLK